MAACNKTFSGTGRHVVIYDMITITLNVEKQMNLLIMPFKCLPSLQIWAFSSMPSCLPIFQISSVYTNLDYLFRRKIILKT